MVFEVVILVILYNVARECYRRSSEKYQWRRLEALAELEKQQELRNLQDSIVAAEASTKAIEAEITQNSRKVIQLVTSKNNKQSEYELVSQQLALMSKQYSRTQQSLKQVMEVPEEYEKLKVEVLVLESSRKKLAERLAKRSNNSQKIVKSINELTIKNFEVNQEIEDNLLDALKEIQLENERLQELSKELLEAVKSKKLKLISMLNDLTDYKERELMTFVEMKIIELEWFAEKLAINKMQLDGESDGLNQRYFVLESLEFEIRKKKRELVKNEKLQRNDTVKYLKNSIETDR